MSADGLMEEHQIVEDITEFLGRYYRDEIGELAQTFPKDQQSIEIEWSDLAQYDRDFAEDLLEHPAGPSTGPRNPRSELNAALRQMELPVDISLDRDSGPSAQVRVRLPEWKQMGLADIRSEHSGTFVALRGQIERVTQTQERITKAVYQCTSCQDIETRQSLPQPKDQLIEPNHCTGPCTGQPHFTLLDDECETVDERQLKLTQPPEEASGAGANEVVYLEGDLAFGDGDTTLMDMAGERVVIHGVLERSKAPTRGRSAKPKFDRYLNADVVEFESGIASDVDVAEHRDDIERYADADDTLHRLIAATAPHLRGGKRMRQIKRGIVLYLFGGARKASDGKADRGDIHMALFGDPATGKTDLLNFVEEVAPRVERLSGTDTTGVGMTATATKDEMVESWVLKPGALPRASGGHAIIDEIDKMSEGVDRLHEALETQRVNVSKAGISAELKTECGVLVAANPTYGRFDGFEEFIEQIDLPTPLFSRFDVLHTLRDLPDQDVDGEVAAGVLDKWTEGGGGDTGQGDDIPSVECYRAWIAMARDLSPTLTEAAAARISEWYVEQREDVDPESDNIPITPRSLSSMRRFAQAHARLNLRETATIEDADLAIEVERAKIGDVYLDEDGKPDVDRLETDTQKGRINSLYQTIADAEDTISRAELADAMDCSDQQLDHDLTKLSRNGRIIRPGPGEYTEA